MADNYASENFPSLISCYVYSKSPMYNTAVHLYGAKYEQRISKISLPRHKFKLKFKGLQSADLDVINNFFIARKGAYESFWFQSPDEAYRNKSWQPNTVYEVNDIVRPVTKNGHSYRCITPGTSGGTEPTWPTGPKWTESDNTVLWQENSYLVRFAEDEINLDMFSYRLYRLREVDLIELKTVDEECVGEHYMEEVDCGSYFTTQMAVKAIAEDNALFACTHYNDVGCVLRCKLSDFYSDFQPLVNFEYYFLTTSIYPSDVHLVTLMIPDYEDNKLYVFARIKYGSSRKIFVLKASDLTYIEDFDIAADSNDFGSGFLYKDNNGDKFLIAGDGFWRKISITDGSFIASAYSGGTIDFYYASYPYTNPTDPVAYFAGMGIIAVNLNSFEIVYSTSGDTIGSIANSIFGIVKQRASAGWPMHLYDGGLVFTCKLGAGHEYGLLLSHLGSVWGWPAGIGAQWRSFCRFYLTCCSEGELCNLPTIIQGISTDNPWLGYPVEHKCKELNKLNPSGIYGAQTGWITVITFGSNMKHYSHRICIPT